MRLPPSARPALLALLLTLLVPTVLSCSTDDAPAAEDAGRSRSPSASASPSVVEPPAWTSLPGPLARCGPQPPSVVAAPPTAFTLRSRALGRTEAVHLGTGRTALVLLHQTDSNGLCGWLPFLPVAAGAGHSVLAVDLCRYGESACAAVERGDFTDADQTTAVATAAAYARRELGARRVVVVGASMGGSVALMSGATLRGVDAVVDLSGPLDWPGVEGADGGRALRVPALVAMADTEGADDVAGARAVAAAAPSGSTFLGAESGHGTDLLTDDEGVPLPMAADVLSWVARTVG